MNRFTFSATLRAAGLSSLLVLSNLSAQEPAGQAPAPAASTPPVPAAAATTSPAPVPVVPPVPAASTPAAPTPPAPANPAAEVAPPSTVAQPAAANESKTPPHAAQVVEVEKKKVAPLQFPKPPVELLTDPEVVKLMAALPVQQSGRVKPLDTFARFMLLAMHGKQTIKLEKFDEASQKLVPMTDPETGKEVKTAGGKSKLSAIEWLLVTWLRPDIARQLPVFVVDNSDAVLLLDLHGRGKRDRYSYDEIDKGRVKIAERMEQVKDKKPEELAPEYRAIVKLANDFLAYDVVLSHFDFARHPFGEEAGTVPREILPSTNAKDLSVDVLLPRVGAYVQPWIADYLAANPGVAKVEGNDRVRILLHMMSAFQRHPDANNSMSPWLHPFVRNIIAAWMGGTPDSVLSIFPPTESGEVWESPGWVMQDALFGDKISEKEMAMLIAYQGLITSGGDSADFKAKVKELSDLTTKMAAQRGESGHIGLELLYHRADFFYRATILFVLASLALAFSWVFPQTGWGRFFVKICWALLLAGALLSTVGIFIRCLIMERPPITTLYETIIFISAAGVIGALLVEWLSRRKGLGLTIACIAGAAGMFLSIRFLDFEAKDSLQQLQAVLITNFWLATHVPIINLGYAAGMVACICSMVYLVRRLFGVTKAGDEDTRTFTRIAYAFILSGLFLSLVGTVLGGVWANYSWGRFWGWDPKENGALMIVLMNLIILHARLGGFIREVGFHVTCIILGMATIFSWFATNQLGIGLHAYGELDGAWKVLYTTWGTMAAFVVYGIILSFLDRSRVSGASAREGQTAGRALRPEGASNS